MNAAPQNREMLEAAWESCLSVIARAQPGKEKSIFAEWSRHAIDHALKAGHEKSNSVDRLREAGIAIGLDEAYIQDCLASAVRIAEDGGTATSKPASPNRRELVMRRASDIEPEAIDWTWRHRITQGKLSLLAGEPGLGKSQLATKVVAIVTTGAEWPCGEGRAKAGGAIMLCAEDGMADTIVPRLSAAGADLSRVHIVSAVSGGERSGHRSFNLQADLDLLEGCRAFPNTRLIVIDPISSYMGKVDSHKNADVRSVLEAAGEMAARHRVALLGITHFSKGGGQKAINQFIGSIAFVAAARTAYAVMAGPETRPVGFYAGQE